MSIVNPTCPTGCNSQINPMTQDPCAPLVSIGELNRLYVMAAGGAILTTWGTAGLAAELLGRIDNTASTVDSIVEIIMSGDVPAAAGDMIEIADNKKHYLPKTHTINFQIDDVNQTVHDFLRYMECNQVVKLWYANPDFIWGGNDGIEINMQMNDVVERGSKGRYSIQGVITWEAKFTPERTDNPFAS